MNQYPRLEINLNHLRYNTELIVNKSKAYNVDIAAVIKGANGIPECAKAFEDGGVSFIASSRLEQLENAREFGIKLPFLMLRVPMLSEIKKLINIADISLNSEVALLNALNDEAKKQNKNHKVILMADLGDLREGFWNKDDLIMAALSVENDLENLILAGIGTNLGCYGSIAPTVNKLNDLVVLAEEIEKRIGRKLEFISGGATSTMLRIYEGNIPKRINLLRVGEEILLAKDLYRFHGCKSNNLRQNIFTLKAEVVEVKDKPSYPIGKIVVDAFGKTPIYNDRGIRRRAIAAIGKADYGDHNEIIPLIKNAQIIGASSDHTILDIEDCETEIKVGDILSFEVFYSSLLYLTASSNVSREFRTDTT